MTNKIIGYHYTNSGAYRSMHTKGIDNHFHPNFNEFTGLIPTHRFIRLGDGTGLPNESYDGVIEGLLEPEPKSWLKNPEFPGFWEYLMGDICREKEVILLSFELKLEDKAYIVERAHVERELYRESKGQGKSTKKTLNTSFKKYWESRVPVFEYDGSYSAPQLAIWSGIEFNRLKVEWVTPTEEVWKRIQDNH